MLRHEWAGYAGRFSRSVYALAAGTILCFGLRACPRLAYNSMWVFFAWLILWMSGVLVHTCREWRRAAVAEKWRAFKRLIVGLTVCAALLSLKILDVLIPYTRLSADRIGLLGCNAPGTELHTLDVYPYTGFHVRANVHLRGKMPLEANCCYDDFDVQSGDHGFFVDFDLDNPPPKPQNEFCIVLVGGSAAQGYGGQSNAQMFYRLLEELLNQRLPNKARHVKVVNLAMANSTSYQNFIALNKWGHALEPDLILSFSGVNDALVPLSQGGSDMPYRFNGVIGLARAAWVSENPAVLRDFLEFYPSINNSLLATSIRVLNAADIGTRATIEYVQAQQYPGFQVLASAGRMYVQAFKSIKRDFSGIPIAIAFQPAAINSSAFWASYNSLYNQAVRDLQGYINTQWLFLDLNKSFRDKDLLQPPYLIVKNGYGVHLLNEGHRVVAQELCEGLLPFVSACTAGDLGTPAPK